MIALITDMNQPLGNAVGNSLEIIQSIEILKGNGPSDITKLVKTEAAYMIMLGEKADSFEQAMEKVNKVINDGSALDVYKRMIEAQNGNGKVIEDYSIFPQAKEIIEVKSDKSGYVSEIDAMSVGIASLMLGAGRENIDSKLDYAVGIKLQKKVGDKVEKDDVLAEFYVNDKTKLDDSIQKFLNAYKFSDNSIDNQILVYSKVDIDKVEELKILR
jgi:pyrimidine-nucleoside phosphorylase